MEPKKMWAYLIHLNENMWAEFDPLADPECKMPPEEIYQRTHQIAIDPALYGELMRFLPEQGINTVLIDVGNGLQFERHPEISMKEALTKEALKEMLDGIRSLGMTPIPKLNFSCGHNPWMREYSRKVGTAEFYRFCNDCIDEVAEVFGYPEYFHLGMDEEGLNKGSHFMVDRGINVWWRDLYRLFDRCSHHNMRPWVWSDAYWYHPKIYAEKMPKSVLQSNWYYAPPRGKDEKGIYSQRGFRTYVEFEELGYDQVPTCSTWQSEDNAEETFRIAKTEIAPERLKGVMTAPWFFLRDDGFYRMMQDALTFGIAKKKYYPED